MAHIDDACLTWKRKNDALPNYVKLTNFPSIYRITDLYGRRARECKLTTDSHPKKKAEFSRLRSSAAEYLTFVAGSAHGGVESIYAKENVWLSQKRRG